MLAGFRREHDGIEIESLVDNRQLDLPRREADIERVLEPLDELTRELWLITHKDLRNTARVRAFFDHVGSGLLEGELPEISITTK
ncbi:hypothetical protein [Labrys neptuniae]